MESKHAIKNCDTSSAVPNKRVDTNFVSAGVRIQGVGAPYELQEWGGQGVKIHIYTCLLATVE